MRSPAMLGFTSRVPHHHSGSTAPHQPQFAALPTEKDSKAASTSEVNQPTITEAGQADASKESSSNSYRVVLLVGLLAAAALVLVASGGVGGLKDRVKARSSGQTNMHSHAWLNCSSGK